MHDIKYFVKYINFNLFLILNIVLFNNKEILKFNEKK